MNSAKSVVEAVMEADDDEGRHQALVSKAYGRWQKGGEHEGKDVASFTAALEEPERMAVVLGKLNQQVTNGGWLQWIDNGYGDAAWPYLQKYLVQLAPISGNVVKLQAIVQSLADMMDNANADSLSALIGDSESDDLRDAILGKDWDEVDRILGGTDLNQRKLDAGIEDFVDNASMNVVKSAREPDRFKFVITTDGPDGGDLVLYDSETDDKLFDSEEAADEAGADHVVDVKSLDDDIRTQLEDAVLGELADEYGKYDVVSDELNRLDKEYFTFNEALMAELEAYFKSEYPDSLSGRLLKALKGGVAAVKAIPASLKGGVAAVKAIPAGLKGAVSQFGKRVARAGRAARDAFQHESAVRLVNNLLLEDDETMPAAQELKRKAEALGWDADVDHDTITLYTPEGSTVTVWYDGGVPVQLNGISVATGDEVEMTAEWLPILKDSVDKFLAHVQDW